jgi:hypothetical protein
MKIAAEFIEKHGGIIDKAKRERQNGQAMFVLPASVMQKKTNEMKKETNVMFMAPDDLHDAKIAAFCDNNCASGIKNNNSGDKNKPSNVVGRSTGMSNVSIGTRMTPREEFSETYQTTL